MRLYGSLTLDSEAVTVFGVAPYWLASISSSVLSSVLFGSPRPESVCVCVAIASALLAFSLRASAILRRMS